MKDPPPSSGTATTYHGAKSIDNKAETCNLSKGSGESHDTETLLPTEKDIMPTNIGPRRKNQLTAEVDVGGGDDGATSKPVIGNGGSR